MLGVAELGSRIVPHDRREDRVRPPGRCAGRTRTAPRGCITPLLAVGRGSELVVTVTFAPASREFVAATAEDDVVREIFRGPSLPLACSAANQALADLAPLPSAARPSRRAGYSRTRPANERDVHFAEALRRLGELAGV